MVIITETTQRIFYLCSLHFPPTGHNSFVRWPRRRRRAGRTTASVQEQSLHRYKSKLEKDFPNLLAHRGVWLYGGCCSLPYRPSPPFVANPSTRQLFQKTFGDLTTQTNNNPYKSNTFRCCSSSVARQPRSGALLGGEYKRRCAKTTTNVAVVENGTEIDSILLWCAKLAAHPSSKFANKRRRKAEPQPKTHGPESCVVWQRLSQELLPNSDTVVRVLAWVEVQLLWSSNRSRFGCVGRLAVWRTDCALHLSVRKGIPILPKNTGRENSGAELLWVLTYKGWLRGGSHPTNIHQDNHSIAIWIICATLHLDKVGRSDYSTDWIKVT